MEETIMVFDTETCSLEKPFAYDIGYVILTREGEVKARKHFVVEQTWKNLPLFESAYYKEKRPLYVLAMRQHKIVMNKWGYIMGEMIRDMKKYNVVAAYAFNSSFDDKVFTFNCDWFHTRNPFDQTPIFDIWGYSSQFLTNTEEYRDFCEANNCINENGNYHGNAETCYKFITSNPDFIEAHMGAMDCDIELVILFHCIKQGAEWDKEYKVVRVLSRPSTTPYTVKVNGEVIHQGEYVKKYVRNGLYSFTEGTKEVWED